MHYSAILVQTAPADHSLIVKNLESLPGVEIHHRYPDLGKCVAVLETGTRRQQEELLRTIQSHPGVLRAELVYHYLDGDGGDRPGRESGDGHRFREIVR